MIAALIGAASVLALAAALVAGAALGHRRGIVAGRTDALRRLIRARDQECHVAAHYLEADMVAEAETQAFRHGDRPRWTPPAPKDKP